MDNPVNSDYEVTMLPDQSPLYKAGSTEVFDIMRNALKDNHKKRRNGIKEVSSIDELEEKIDIYFSFCSAKKKLPTPAGLMASLGVNHKQLLTVLKGNTEISNCLQNALEVMHAIYQEGVVEGSIPVKVYTFMAKNYWGMTDKEIVEIKQENGEVSISEIDARINRLKKIK